MGNIPGPTDSTETTENTANMETALARRRARWRPGPGVVVMAAGVGVTGLPVVRYLAATGATVLVTSNRTPPAELADIAGDIRFVGDPVEPPELVDTEMGERELSAVITSAGLPPHHPLLTAAQAQGLEVIGEVELAWRLDHQGDPDELAGAAPWPLTDPAAEPRDWLVVTGTNGKTTTTGMLESILQAAGRRVTACGNIGWPVLEAVLAQPRQDVIAVELSSFQLHWAPSVWPRAGVVLNVAEDHLDWHGSMAAYAGAKAQALTGEIAVAVVDDAGALALLKGADQAGTRIGITAGAPRKGMLGVWGGALVDAAFRTGELLPAVDVRPAGVHNVTNALAAAALALSVDVTAAQVAAGLRAYAPGAHRNVPVGNLRKAGPDDAAVVRFVDDSKATNPHAALASLTAYDRVVWVAGGQLKGATVDDLVVAVRDRLVGVVLLGVDAPLIAAALARHAPDVPRVVVPGRDDDVMRTVVRTAADMAGPGDVVLLAPAAASLDMFRSYAARGVAFAAAVAELPGAEGPA